MPHAHDLMPIVRRQLQFCFAKAKQPGFPDDPAAIREVREVLDGLRELFLMIDPDTGYLHRLPGLRPMLLDDGCGIVPPSFPVHIAYASADLPGSLAKIDEEAS